MSAAATASVRGEWRLQREHELRCEIPENASLTLRLLTGNAEIFGIEMAPSKEYAFKGQNLAVFTWHGCSLESVSSSKEVYLYQVESTPMSAYVNTHIQLEARRDIALGTQCDGPRVRISKLHNVVLTSDAAGFHDIGDYCWTSRLRKDDTCQYFDILCCSA
jgi:polyribonucleotide 5'-hydroxyl-kinase